MRIYPPSSWDLLEEALVDAEDWPPEGPLDAALPKDLLTRIGVSYFTKENALEGFAI